MKTLCMVISALLLLSFGSVEAQKIEGKLTVSGLRSDTRIKQTTVVDIFQAFKDGTYKINFSYKADKVGKRGLVIFDMKTTVKHNGKVIKETTRKNWPWLPDDILPSLGAPSIAARKNWQWLPGDLDWSIVPIESFDLISALQAYTFEMPAPKLYSKEIDLPLPKGKYEVSLQMVGMRPERVFIPPAQFSFVVE